MKVLNEIKNKNSNIAIIFLEGLIKNQNIKENIMIFSEQNGIFFKSYNYLEDFINKNKIFNEENNLFEKKIILIGLHDSAHLLNCN